MFSVKAGLLHKAQGKLGVDLQALDARSSIIADWFKEQFDRFKEDKNARHMQKIFTSTLRQCQACENDLDTDNHCYLY